MSNGESPPPSVREQAKAHAQPTDSERDAIRRAQRGEALMKDPLLVEAFDNLETTWMTIVRYGPGQVKGERITGAAAKEIREKAYVCLSVLDLLRAELQKFVTDGKIATTNIAQRQEQAAAVLEDLEL